VPEPDAAPDADAPAGASDDVAVEEAPAAPVDPTSPESEDEVRLAALQALKDALGDAVVGAHIRDGDDLWVRVTTEAWRDAAQTAKSRLGCTGFCFLSGLDWLPSPWGRNEDSPFDESPNPADVAAQTTEYETGYAGGDTRFQLMLRVTNPTTGFGLTIKTDVADPEVGVATLIPVYPGVNWHEREAHEMFGIEFIGHPNLVNLYLPGAFEGHPLRKDFPLLARQVKPWPGIVDVEPMPAGDDDEEAEAEEAAP
jgi:NADH-quinone oxidoreductase subunit C